jgi:hypothetical protein
MALAVFDLLAREEGTRVSPPRFFLEHVSTRKRISLHNGFCIGRKGCDLNFPEDSVMSRRHCKFEIMPDGGIVCWDLNATNPTRVNDRDVRADRPVRLQAGDRLEIGSQFFTAVDPGARRPEQRLSVVKGGGAVARDHTRRTEKTPAFTFRRLFVGMAVVPALVTVLGLFLGLFKIPFHYRAPQLDGTAQELTLNCFDLAAKNKARCEATLGAIVKMTPKEQKKLLAAIPADKSEILAKIIKKARGTTVAMRAAAE